MREPGCAVRSSEANGGAISARRYESYRRLRNLVGQLEEARGAQTAQLMGARGGVVPIS